MCKNWKEKGNCKYGDKCLFAHGESELSKRETVASPQKEVIALEIETASQITEETPAKVEDSVVKSVLSPSIASESNLEFTEDLLVTEVEPDFKDMVTLPQKLIYEELGFG